MPILRGEEGSLPFFAKAPKTAIETGVKATTKNGLNYKATAPAHSNTVTMPHISLLRFVSDWKMPNKV